MAQGWFVRAGREDEYEELDFAESVIAIGWREIGDLSNCSTATEISAQVSAAYPELSAWTRNSYAIQLHVFRQVIQPDDVVVLLRAKAPEIAVGRVTGEYRYAPGSPAGHLRPVEWVHRSIRRSEVPGIADPPALSMLFRVGDGHAFDELQKLVGRVPDSAVSTLEQRQGVGAALATSVAYDNLSRNLNYARNLTAAGSHLEHLKVSLFEVTDVYRAAWVQSVAAIDHWVHQEICDRMVRLSVDPARRKPDGYSRFPLPLDLVERVRAGKMSFQEALAKGVRETLAFKTYQSPEKIQEGFAYVADVKNLWNRVAGLLNEQVSDKLSGNDVRATLREIVHRRNKIAHEYDEDPVNSPAKLAIDAATTLRTIDWLDGLAMALLAVLDQE